MTHEELLRAVKALCDVSNQKTVRDLRERILWLNTQDKKNAPIFEVAREKGLI